MTDTEKTWWAPVWRGLVVDPTGKHYRRLKLALWLYLYLILHARRETGQLACKLTTAERATGIGRRTLQRWLARLRRHGYIAVRQTGRAVHVDILRWRRLRNASHGTPLPRHTWRPRDATSGTPAVPPDHRKT